MAYLFAPCPKCKEDNFPEAEVCKKCGASLLDAPLKKVDVRTSHEEIIERHRSPRICPECGWSNPATFLKCGKCQHQLVKPALKPTKVQTKKEVPDIVETTPQLPPIIQQKPRIKIRHSRPIVLLSKNWGWIVLLLFIFWQPIYNEWLIASNSSTTAGILASDMSFTNKAKIIYFGSSPQVEDKVQFQASCTDSSKTPELGCFDPNTKKIYYLQIDSSEFAPETNVAATHEMLHAAYMALSDQERARVNTLVEAEALALNNKDLNDTMAIYATTEPGQRDNELHSILATEYGGLSQGLEDYYSQYFQDRTVVVAAHQSFKDAVDLKTATINASATAINARKNDLTVFKGRMNYLLNTGQIYSYNSQVDTFNSQVNSYNQSVNAYNKELEDTKLIFNEIDSTQISSYSGITTQ